MIIKYLAKDPVSLGRSETGKIRDQHANLYTNPDLGSWQLIKRSRDIRIGEEVHAEIAETTMIEEKKGERMKKNPDTGERVERPMIVHEYPCDEYYNNHGKEKNHTQDHDIRSE